jgi:SAM-dependent methyltransferase
MDQPYFPESKDELNRLEDKTDISVVIDQARWAGLQNGMQVLDVGCGPGITTFALAEVAGSSGRVVGIDRSEERIAYARGKYEAQNVEFVQCNFFDDHSALGQFDFVWMRFIHEYFLKEAYQLTEHISKLVKPGGVLCLIDLDRNCLNYHGHSARLERNIQNLFECFMKNNNFDPNAGIKLYGHLHDLGFINIRVDVRAHNLIYGELSERIRNNFWQKIGMGGRQSGWTFEDYEDGFAGFEREFKTYFESQRRFCYTPLIISRGVKPFY